MKSWIKPPIIVHDPGDIDVFDSIESAERYLEPIDVEENILLVAFDSVGRLLRLLPTTPRVTIEAAEEVPNHAEQVRELLIKFLKDCRSTEPNLSSLTLAELVQKSLAFKTR
jgi:hypothetical protein